MEKNLRDGINYSDGSMYQKDCIDEWVIDHLGGINANQIAKKYGCSHPTVVMWLKRRGIFRKATKEVSSKERDLMRQLYKDSYSLPEIAKKVNFSHETVRYWVTRANLIRNVKEAKKVQHYRNVKPLPLTKELAFFLGVHAGDGSLGAGKKNLTRWRCDLDKKEPQLAKIISGLVLKLFGARVGLIKWPNNGSMTLSAYNKNLAVTLEYYGFPCGKKSRILKVPSPILKSKSLPHIRAFIAGHLATDGCICVGDNKYPRADFSTSSKIFSRQLVTLLNRIGVKAWSRSYVCKNSFSSKEKYKVHIPAKSIKKFLSEVPVVNDKQVRRLNRVKTWSFSKL